MSRRMFWLSTVGAGILYLWSVGMIATSTRGGYLYSPTAWEITQSLLWAGGLMIGSLALWWICCMRRWRDHGKDWRWTLPSTPVWVWQILKVGYLISYVIASYILSRGSEPSDWLGLVVFLLYHATWISEIAALCSLAYILYMLWQLGIQKTPEIER